jgi:hypothetical protein
MKQSILQFLIAMTWFVACKKTSNISHSNDLIAAAKNYFESSVKTGASDNPRFSSGRTVNWGSAAVIKFGNTKAVIARIQYLHNFYTGNTVDPKRFYAINEITWLCVYKDTLKNYHAEQVAFFPDSNFQKNKPFKGLIAVDDYGGNALKKFRVVNNNTILQPAKNDNAGTVTENGTAENSLAVTETCNTIYEYNYSVDDPDNGYYSSEPAGCDYSITSEGGDGDSYGGIVSSSGASGSGGGSISPAASFTVLNGNNVIGNIADYNKCFTNIAGSGNTFSVTVCVAQPDPGTRTAWTPSLSGAAGSTYGDKPVSTGHTFLIFSQTTGAGTIARNVGFYPSGFAVPTSPISSGQLNNDDEHSYNISLKISVNNSQFFNMLGYVDQSPGLMYNLNTFNCTTFALKTLLQGDISLPATTGSWPGGSGNDPGDLGQDIMFLNLTSNMTRSTTAASHPNIGSCN